jgi:putative FmdB family regulatory protein
MPTYSYRCDCCGHEFDQRQKFSDPNLVQCPNCDEGCLRRVYKPARVVFKGSGFYVTDNKSTLRQSSISKNNDKSEKSPAKEEKANKKKETAKASEKKQDK